MKKSHLIRSLANTNLAFSLLRYGKHDYILESSIYAPSGPLLNLAKNLVYKIEGVV